MNKQFKLVIFFFLLFGLLRGQTQDWQDIVSQFVEDYRALNIPSLQLAYEDNLRAIQDVPAIEAQILVFNNLEQNLIDIDRDSLPVKQHLEYDLLQYYVSLHQQRLQLEAQWANEPLDNIPAGGLYTLPNGKAWYQYYLKRWVDLSVDPDEIYDLGLKEIQKVLAAIDHIQEQSGLDSVQFQQYIDSTIFYYHDKHDLQQAYETYAAEVAQVLSAHFPGINSISPIDIEQGSLPRLAQVPGYYNSGTFYYNYFDQPYNKRQIAWIYLHEALPGHHYEISYRQTLSILPIQQLMNFPGYSEGWAAYVENVGLEIDVYPTLYDALGKWEWDLIRSVRVSLDVGLNYYGWSDEEAISFWNKYIHGQDEIALREIARMKRWPCQVITYKYGASKILDWKAHFQQVGSFDLLAFHKEVLNRGPLPFSLLEKILLHPEQQEK